MDQFCSRRIDLTPINYFLRPETRYHHPHQSSKYDAFLSQARDHCFTRLAKMRRNTVTYWTAVFANRETCSLIRLNDDFRKTLLQAARKKPRKLTDHSLFQAFSFSTPHRSPLSERLEQAKPTTEKQLLPRELISNLIVFYDTERMLGNDR